MTLISLIGGQLAYGLTPLLDGANLNIQPGERVGLIGRNGTGKSSLLSILAKRSLLEEGELQSKSGLRVTVVEQEPLLPPADTMLESLQLRGDFEHQADERQRWRIEARLIEYLDRFSLPTDISPERASGGECKRGALALALALDPDLLLLDEPTNHLDVDAIRLLEDLLITGPSAVFVTHDRSFLDRVATRIIELDRGYLRSYPGNFTAYTERKEEQLAAEKIANRKFDKFWAQEEVWIRRGVEARRTRNEGRVRRLESLRNERADRRERMGSVKLSIDARERSGKLVAELKNVTKVFGERTIVSDLSMSVMRGDRIAILGPNGAGKSTLIKLLLATLDPDSGSVRLGTNVQVAYFDQMREQLDLDKTVAATISPGSDWVEIGTERKHITSYLADFLFSPQRAGTPVRALSGGERNRLLLARLFARPANVLVLDEPTNDLDIESLELLEQAIQDFPGTVLLVSHDRVFVDNVVTQTLAPLGEGRWKEYVGGYSDWLNQRPAGPAVTSLKAATIGATVKPVKKAKLSYKDQRELEGIPAEIEALEAEQRLLTERISTPNYAQKEPAQLAKDGARIAALEKLLHDKLERWDVLEAASNGIKATP